jgi:hypothetical protein
LKNDTVYFTGSLKKETGFLLRIKVDQLSQLPDDLLKQQTGYYQPAVNDSVVGFTNFTATGFHFETIPRKNIHWETVSKADIETPAGNFNVPSLSAANAAFLAKIADSTIR